MLRFRPVVAGIVTLLALAANVASAHGEGLLGDLREDVRSDEDVKKRDDDDDDDDDRRRHAHDCRCCDCCDDTEGDGTDVLGWGGIIAATLTAPIWAPISIAGDNYNLRGEFPVHPYANGMPGYMVIGAGHSVPTWPWSTRLGIEFAEGIQDVSRIGVRGLFETRSRLGADASVNFWSERLASIDDDGLATGDVNLLYRFAQCSLLTVRAGAGMNWLADESRADFGWNLTYQADLFPAPAWVLSGELDGGSLGNAGLFHTRATAGYCLSLLELYVGIDYLRVGDTDLAGIVAGVRLWN